MSIHEYKRQNSFVVLLNATQVIITFAVPSKCRVTTRKFSNYVDNVLAWGGIVWRLLRNGIPIPPYEAIRDPRGSQYLLDAMEPVTFYGGDLLEVIAENAYAGAASVGIGAALGFDQEE